MIRSIFWCAALAIATLSLPAADSVGWHVVKQGETLEGITARYLGTPSLWRENWKLNPGLKNPNVLTPGQRIRVILARDLPARFATVRKVARRVEKKPEPQPWVPARAGDRLEERQGIRTHVASSAELGFEDDTVLTLGERSLVFLRTAKTTPARRDRSEIEIIEGEGDLEKPARSSARHDIEITVGTAVAVPQASGSRTRLRSADKKAQVMAYRGSAQVRGGDAAVRVEQGMGVSVPEGGPPSRPEKLLPAPKTAAMDVSVPRPTFRWATLPGATSWTVEICRDRNCGEVVERSPLLEDVEWRPAAALPAGEHFWRVTAKSASGLDGYPAVAPLVVRLGLSGSVRTEASPASGVEVALYRADALQSTTRTAADGSWSFRSLAPGEYLVAVRSRTIQPAEAWAEQVTGPAGAICNGERRTEAGGCAGGRRPGVSDSAGSPDEAEHVAVIGLAESPVDGLDFGFSHAAVTTETDSGQGSLRQFLMNANAVPGPQTMRFLPAAAPGAGGGWVVRPSSPLPSIRDSGTTLDGAARNPRDPAQLLNADPAEIGTVTVVGQSGAFLRNPARPELVIDFGGAALGLDAEAAVTVRNLGLTGARLHLRAGAGLTLENAVIGRLLERHEPSAGVEIHGEATIRRVLVTAQSEFGIAVRRGGRLDAEDLEVSDCGYGAVSGDGVAIESDGSRIHRALFLLNTSGSGLAISSGRQNAVEESTFRGNRVATASSALEGENRFSRNVFEDNILAALIARGSGRLPAPRTTSLFVAPDGSTHVAGTAPGASRVDVYSSDEQGTLTLITTAETAAGAAFDAAIGVQP